MRSLNILFLAALSLWLAGCATHRINWDNRVGTYTYDQAVLEMGPPDKEAVLTDGTRIDEWLIARGRSQGTIHYLGATMRQYEQYRGPDYFLRLQFSPEGLLQDWKRVPR